MKMKSLLFGVLLFLAGCATSPTANYSLRTAYELINSYAQLQVNLYQRGRMTEEEFRSAMMKAQEADAFVDGVVDQLANCKPPACDPQQLIQSFQPYLLALEKDLREKQK